MSAKRNKKRQQGPQEPDRSAADYYRLKSEAVEALVTANESNSPPVSEEELNKYRAHPRRKFPLWLKVVLVKTWFYGAACFFFLWGLGGYMADQLDLFFVTAIGLDNLLP